MPQFVPGESKTAKATMSNPKGVALDYTGFLYIGSAQVAEVSFHLNAGEEKVVSFPVTVPSTTGTYSVLLYIYSGGQGISLYRATEDVVVVPRSPPLPPAGQANLYGVVTDTSTGAPLPGVKASIGILGYEFSGIQATSVNPSDSTGYYVITSCGITGSMITLPGTYRVIFLKDGYQSVVGTINLVEGNNILNAQLAPVTQVEMPFPGGALVGINGQHISGVGALKEPVTFGSYDADGNFYEIGTTVPYTGYAIMATPVKLPTVMSLVLNLIDRTFSGTYDATVFFYPAEPIVGYPAESLRVKGWASSGTLPCTVDIALNGFDPGPLPPWIPPPEVKHGSGQAYNTYVRVDLYPYAGGAGGMVFLILNAVILP